MAFGIVPKYKELIGHFRPTTNVLNIKFLEVTYLFLVIYRKYF